MSAFASTRARDVLDVTALELFYRRHARRRALDKAKIA